MKKKTILSIVALMLFAFSNAALAITPTKHTSASCCAKDSCPMKGKNSKDSCCDADCCKDGKCTMDCCKDKDSCPMKKTESSQETSSVDTSKVKTVAKDGDCCNGGSCCKSGASCCHKKADF